MTTPSMRTWLALALVIPALWLAYQTVALAAARLNAGDDPEQALSWMPGYGPALSRQAENLAIGASTPAEYAQAVTAARRALASAPLEVRPLRILGTLADRQGDVAQAEALMSAAARRSLRDPVAHVWLFERRMDQQDWTRAFFHGDVLMQKPLPGYNVRSAMTLAAFDPRASGALLARMGERPSWRTAIITEVAEASPPQAFDMLMRLKQAGSPPSDKESAAVVGKMIDEGAVLNAFVAWAQLLPPSAAEGLGDIYDSGFDGMPGAPPFNWALHSKDDYGAELAPGPDGEGHALYAHYSARKPAPLARQVLLLPPGRYQLVAKAYLEDPQRGEQLVWSLECYDGAELAKMAAPDEALVWTDVKAFVDIPASGCDAQRLVLTGRPGMDRSDQVRGWFDQIALQRIR